MKKRLTAWMIALFVPLLAAVFLLFLQQSFVQTLEREQERAQMAEGMIYLQLRDVFDGLTYSQGVETARSYRSLYAAQGITLYFLYHDQPVAGALLPNRNYDALLTGGRAALLDTLSVPQLYAIADPLNSDWTLLTIRDVGDLYTLRDRLRRTALWIVLGAGGLTALLCYALASWFTAPVKRLTKAAGAVRQGTFDPALLPKKPGGEIGLLSDGFCTCTRQWINASGIWPRRRKAGSGFWTRLPMKCARRCARFWATPGFCKTTRCRGTTAAGWRRRWRRISNACPIWTRSF